MLAGKVWLCIPVFSLAVSAEAPAGWADKIRQAQSRQSQGHFAEAESLYQSALHEAERLPGRVDLEVLALSGLASVEIDLGRLEEAAQRCERAISILVKSVGEADPRVQVLRTELAGMYLESGQPGTAEKLLRQTIALQKRGGRAATREAAFALDVLACLYARQKKPAAAEEAERQALSALEAGSVTDPAAAAVDNVHLSIFLNSQKRATEALPYAERGLMMLQALPDRLPVMEAGAEMSLASIHAGLGRRNEAEAESERALQTTESFYGPTHVQTGWMLLARAAVLRRTDRKQEARMAQKRGENIVKGSGGSRLGETVPLEALLPR